MTIDSKYLPRTYEISAGDTEYYFEYESIGGETVKPLVQYTEADGYVWYGDLSGTVTTTYGGRAPLYSRGKLDFLSGQDVVYGDIPNAKLYVQRDTEITQLLDLIPYTPFPAEDFEFGLDKLTLILQEIDGEACSCPWGGTESNPNPPPSPPIPPGEGYVCSSQVDAATDQGIDYSLNLTSDDPNWPYPFATSGSNATLGDPTKFAAFRDYVSGPTLLPDWNSTLPAKQDVTGFADYDSLSLYEQCQITNTMTQMVGMQTTQSSPVAIIPPSNITTGTAYQSSTSVFTVTGFAGSGINSGSTLLSRQLGCTRKNVSFNTQYSDVAMSVQINGDVNGDAVVSVSVGEGAGLSSFTIDAGNYVQKWVNVVVTETTTFELISNFDPCQWRDVVTIKVTVTQEDGTTETQTVVGYEEKIFTYDATYFSFDYVSYDQVPNGFYLLPVMFYGGVNRKVSIGYLAYGPGEADHATLSYAFLRNFTNYTP